MENLNYYITIALYFIPMLLLTWREGVQERYTHIEQDPEKKRKLSKIWHALGGFARVVLAGLSWFIFKNIWMLLISLLIVSVLYNIVINLCKGHKWWFVGTTALTDKLIRKIFFFINFNKAL